MTRFALVLTGPELTEDHVAAVRGIGEVTGETGHWLGRAEAWEVQLAVDATGAIELRDTSRLILREAAIDVNIVNCADRIKSLLIADMDSTIIEQECIDEIAGFAGYGAEVAAITEQAMRGEIDFEPALRQRVKLLEGLDTAALSRVIQERLSITPGAATLVTTMKKFTATCALVSGGFTFFTGHFAQKLGFDVDRANTLEIVDGRVSGRPVAPILGRQAKLDALNELCSTHDIEASQVIAVGDGANDLAMIKAAGLGVAFRAKPLVAAQANAQILHSDLTALLYLQGICREDFATHSM